MSLPGQNRSMKPYPLNFLAYTSNNATDLRLRPNISKKSFQNSWDWPRSYVAPRHLSTKFEALTRSSMVIHHARRRDIYR